MLFPSVNIPLFVIPKFDFLQFLGYIQKFRITSIAGVPPIMVALAKHPAVDKFDLSSLTGLGSGAAPLGKDIIRDLEGKLNKKYKNNLKIRQGWGMTEATCSVMGFHPDDQSGNGGSVGELYANCEAKVCTD